MAQKQQSTTPTAADTEGASAPRAQGPSGHITFAACCLVFFVSIIFLHNHHSMAYVHSTIVYSLEAPAGWLQSTSKTTVRAFTIKNAAGEAVTRAAVTATTTTTTVAARAAAADAGSRSTKQAVGTQRFKRSSISSMWRDHHTPQHSSAHAASRAQQGDIELQPQKVALVVQQAKEAEQQAATTSATTPAEQYAGLYGAGGAGSVVFEPQSDLHSCPEGTAAPKGATALLLLADSSSGAAVLKRSLDGLMLLYSQASADIRAAFHLFIGLDGGDTEMQALAHQYAVDSLGTLKLVHHKTTTTSSSSSSGDRATAEQSTGDSSSSSSRAVRAEHVRLMLHVFLECFQYPSVLLLEDDWKLLPDFLEYFDATHWLMSSDTALTCVSAWNPLGLTQQQQQQQDAMAGLQRVDTNPGRGWLLNRATGLQLLKTWPQGSSDLDWQQHIHTLLLQYGQQCVVPDVSRMLPAAVHDTADAAHIVPAADVEAAAGKAGVQPHASGPDSSSSSSSESNAAAVTAGAEGAPDAGAVDHEAETAPEVAWKPTVEAAAAATAGGGSSSGAADQGASGSSKQAEAPKQEQQQQQVVSSGVHGGAARSAWQGRDVSHMLGSSYRQAVCQRLLEAKTVDATTAAQATAQETAVLVAYSSAAELSAAAEVLGVPLDVTQGARYCYNLPTPAAPQHCQDFLPDMAYEGVVAAHTRHGVRLYLVHLAYISALRGSDTANLGGAAEQVATV